MPKKFLGMSGAEFDKKYGKYNDAPPNFKEITEKEFAQSKFFIYSPNLTDSRQILDFEEKCLSVNMYFFFDGSGVAMASDHWEGKVRYFSFTACDHTYRELNFEESHKEGLPHFGNCYHVLKCTKCDFVTAYDSSG